jgi:hypothetical protein
VVQPADLRLVEPLLVERQRQVVGERGRVGPGRLLPEEVGQGQGQ